MSGYSTGEWSEPSCDDYVDLPFLGEVKYATDEDYWSANVHVNNHNTHFKLDSGAKITVISKCEPWLCNVKLEKSGEILYGPGGTKQPVIGTFKASLAYKTKKMEETIYIIKDQKSSLRSWEACCKLNLII